MSEIKKITLIVSFKKYVQCCWILLPKNIELLKVIMTKVLFQFKIELEPSKKSCRLILKSIVLLTPTVRKKIESTKSFRF